MGKFTNLGSAKADDPIYTGGPQVYFRPPSPPLSGGITPSTAGAQKPEKKRATSAKLPPAPVRADFNSQEEFEEAQGGWRGSVGKILALAKAQQQAPVVDEGLRQDAAAWIDMFAMTSSTKNGDKAPIYKELQALAPQTLQEPMLSEVLRQLAARL